MAHQSNCVIIVSWLIFFFIHSRLSFVLWIFLRLYNTCLIWLVQLVLFVNETLGFFFLLLVLLNNFPMAYRRHGETRNKPTISHHSSTKQINFLILLICTIRKYSTKTTTKKARENQTIMYLITHILLSTWRSTVRSCCVSMCMCSNLFEFW